MAPGIGGSGLIGVASAVMLPVAAGIGGSGLIGVAAGMGGSGLIGVAAGIGGSGLMGVARACPAANAAKAAPKMKLRKLNEVEIMRGDSLCREMGHYTARVTLIVQIVYHESNR